MNSFNNIYKGKNVLITGHTGFKGSWLSIWLLELGAKVIGYALDPYTEKDNFVLSGLSDRMTDIRGDIRNKDNLQTVFDKYKPEFVFHLAAQPLVRLSYEQPVETYQTNVMGTINVMECIRVTPSVKVGIMITTDKVYDNKEQIWGYREKDALGGYDPYSSSKGAAEIAIASWRNSFFNPNVYEKHGKTIASVRAGNVIGGGDWALDRIVPDCIRSIEENKPIEIRNLSAIRPWQHVLEPLSGYLLLGQKIFESPTEFADSWNFGPDYDSIIKVWDLAKGLVDNYGEGKLIDVSDPRALHEAKLLALDITKAKYLLNWKAKWNIDKTIKYTVDWYLRYRQEDVYKICVEHINRY